MLKRLLLSVTCIFFAEYTMAIEEPKYTVIEAYETFELRAYKPMIIAETRVGGDMDDAGTAGFRVIANYIFGNNTPSDVPSDTSSESAKNKINMTAPVSMKLESEKISMTAPVSMQAKNGQWLVHFVMPEKYSLSTLPTPNNPAVVIKEVPARSYAAIRFSGFAGPIKVDRKIAELMAWLKEKGITPISEPEMARYDAPWVLPFLRRNEIMIQY